MNQLPHTATAQSLPFPIPQGNDFLIGLIFSQRLTAERAWSAPKELLARLGCGDVADIVRYPVDDIAAAIRMRPALHPFGPQLASWVWLAGRRLIKMYSGDADRIWMPAQRASVILERLRGFDGIGPHKANVGLFLLVAELGVAVLNDGTQCDAVSACPRLGMYFTHEDFAEKLLPA